MVMDHNKSEKMYSFFLEFSIKCMSPLHLNKMPARIISLWNYPLHETSNILGPVGIQIFYQPSRKESLRL